jgi:hypothetical protein
MRYSKGSLQLSPARDLPLLRQVLRSEFVTRSQLFELARLDHYERSRSSFAWRIRRLKDRQLILQHELETATGEAVYSIARRGAELLQEMGEYCLVGRGPADKEKANRKALHAIGLNEIRLSALRAGLLLRWVGSLEIRSQNELTAFGFAKDYDAIVTVRTESGERRFALEYERTPKAATCYRAIASSIREEIQVPRLLYLAPNYDLARFLSGFFANIEYPVFFGLVSDWHSSLLEMLVLDGSSGRTLPLREALDGGPSRPAGAARDSSYFLPFH